MKTAFIAGLFLALGGAVAAAPDVAQPDAAQHQALPDAPQSHRPQQELRQQELPQPAPAPAPAMKPPQLSYAEVDWQTAAASLADVDMLGPPVRARNSRAPRHATPALARLNAVMSAHFAALTTSPVPVLLPFDVTARLRDQAEGNVADDARYLSGFHAAKFFYPGPAGYDAAFAIRASDVPEFRFQVRRADRGADLGLRAAL